MESGEPDLHRQELPTARLAFGGAAMASPTQVNKVDVVLTAGCNLRCSYCYQNDKKARRMKWETLRASADLVLASGRPEVSLLFVGGEPLLEFDLIRQAVEYVEARRQPGRRIRYELITNGVLVRDEHIDFFVDHDFEVQLSFDGIAPAQDLRGRGTFEVLDRLLHRLRREQPAFFTERVTVAMTLTVASISYFADSVEYFLESGVQDLAVSPTVNHEYSWTASRIDELDVQFARIFDQSLRVYNRTGTVPLKVFRRNEGDSVHKPEGQSMCGVGRGETAAIDVDGQVHGCVMFAESYQIFPTAFLKDRLAAMRMGHLQDPRFAEHMAAYPTAARAAGIFHNKQDKYSSYGKCADCRFLPRCAVCPISIGNAPGNTDPNRVPDFLCAYNLVSLKYRERFPSGPTPRDMLTGAPPLSQLAREFQSLFMGRSQAI
jgi:sulfatase maturation enzyme AslB (radical SAM superfamily)